MISNAEGKQAIRQDWRLRSVEAAAKLQGMLTELAAVRAGCRAGAWDGAAGLGLRHAAVAGAC